MATVATFSPAIAGTKPIVCKYKGSLYFPAMYYFNRGWENPIFRKDRFRNNYYDNLKKKDPDSWAIWPLVYQDPNRQVQAGEYPDQPKNPAKDEGRPNRYNLFGTDQAGIDVFAQMVHGTRTALLVGFVSMGIAGTIGIIVGALAGFFGGWVDMLLSRLIEVVMSIPVARAHPGSIGRAEQTNHLAPHGGARLHGLDQHRAPHPRRIPPPSRNGFRYCRPRHGLQPAAIMPDTFFATRWPPCWSRSHSESPRQF